jgi:hypothetical protein
MVMFKIIHYRFYFVYLYHFPWISLTWLTNTFCSVIAVFANCISTQRTSIHFTSFPANIADSHDFQINTRFGAIKNKLALLKHPNTKCSVPSNTKYSGPRKCNFLRHRKSQIFYNPNSCVSNPGSSIYSLRSILSPICLTMS